MREAAIFHGLRGFLIEVRSFFGVIGIDGDDYAAARHDCRVVGNGVVGFHFVGPPIAERGSTCSCGGDFVGYFVAFEHVLERANLEAEFLGDAKQHQDFVFAITMRVNVALSFEDLDKRIEAKIAARRNRAFVAGGDALVVIHPCFLVVESLDKRGSDGLFDAHARSGITRSCARDAEVGALGIFTERELDAGNRAFKRELRGGQAPAEFDDYGLAADGVCGTMQDVGDGHTAGEIAKDVNVIRIEDVRDIHHRRDGYAAFVHAAVDGNVRVAVDDSGDYELARGVVYLRIFWRLDGGPHFGDFAILNKDGAVFDGAVGNR